MAFNNRGIFCFALVLAFAAIELNFLEGAGSAEAILGESVSLGFETEKVSLTRAVIENSVDKAIEESLMQGLVLDLEAGEIKKETNKRLIALFEKIEESHSREIRARFARKAFAQDFLNQNSSVIVQRIDKRAIEASYSFTGGLEKGNEVSAEISSKGARAFFKLVPGYTVKASFLEVIQ